MLSRFGFVRLQIVPGADRATLNAMRAELLTSPAQAVHVGDFGETWMEHDLPPGGLIAACLASPVAHRWVEAVTRAELAERPALWGNVYREGQHITWHRDKRGAVQMLICLGQPPVECGGILQARSGGKSVDISLCPGDGLLFRATQIEHRITPLTPSPSQPVPVRVTAVGRFFAKSDVPRMVSTR